MSMEQLRIQINEVPAIIWGTSSEKVYLYIHGQGGCKEEAELFSAIVCQHGWPVLSIDLPEHGDRKSAAVSFEPWNVIPELTAVMEYAKQQWQEVSLFANSIGAWFSMLSFGNEHLRRCLFVSPVLDMKQLILRMMKWADVSEERLKQELVIPTTFGQTLSWEYWQYVLAHPVTKWEFPTKILYGEQDHLVERSTVEEFCQRFGCELTVMEKGEHWFHTEQQLDVLGKWIRNSLLSLKPMEKTDIIGYME